MNCKVSRPSTVDQLLLVFLLCCRNLHGRVAAILQKHFYSSVQRTLKPYIVIHKVTHFTFISIIFLFSFISNFYFLPKNLSVLCQNADASFGAFLSPITCASYVFFIRKYKSLLVSVHKVKPEDMQTYLTRL